MFLMCASSSTLTLYLLAYSRSLERNSSLIVGGILLENGTTSPRFHGIAHRTDEKNFLDELGFRPI